jgi:hypothetical protein
MSYAGESKEPLVGFEPTTARLSGQNNAPLSAPYARGTCSESSAREAAIQAIRAPKPQRNRNSTFLSPAPRGGWA